MRPQNIRDSVNYSTWLSLAHVTNEPRYEKTGLWGFRPGPTQPGCTATEDRLRFEISDLESRVIVLSTRGYQKIRALMP